MRINLPFKLNEREKKFIVIGGIIAVLILAYHGFEWYTGLKERVKDVSDARMVVLRKQLNKIAQREELENRIKTILQDIARREKRLLSGDKTPVAAAALQEFLKQTATSLNIEVRLERTLNPVETEFYLGIPVEIGFTATTRELQDLIYRLRKSQYLLVVSEVKIRVTNIRDPNDINTTLVVTGFIRNPESDHGGEAGDGDAA